MPDFVPNRDNDEWTVELPDDTAVNVVIRDRSNGGRIGTYWVDESGDRLSYHSFRINSVDQRIVTANDDQPPGQVIRALHSGGWQVKNASEPPLPIVPTDPPVVQLLDMRDLFLGIADSTDVEVDQEFNSMTARTAREIMVTMIKTHWVAELTDNDPDTEFRKMIDDHQGPDSINKAVHGQVMNMIEDTHKRDDYRNAILELAEEARDRYRTTGDWAEVIDSLEDHPAAEKINPRALDINNDYLPKYMSE